MLSREYVESILRDNGYLNVFVGAVHKAAASWVEVIAGSPNNMQDTESLEKSVYLSRRVFQIIEEELENDPNVIVTHDKHTKAVTINNEITLRFKKLNHALRTMNIDTERNQNLWQENTRLLPGDFSEWINLTFGWQLDRMGIIKQLAIVNEFGNRLEWFILVGDETITSVQEEMVVNETQDDPSYGYVAKLRDTDRARRIAKSDAEESS